MSINNVPFPEPGRWPNGNPICNSWVVEDQTTGKAVCETFSRPYAERIHLYHSETHRVWSAYQWLVNLNEVLNA